MLCLFIPGTVFASEKVFEGEAIPTITSVLNYGFNDSHRGILDYVARPGTIFKPACYDAKGNVIREGDVLLHINSTYRTNSYEKAKADLAANIAAYKDAEQIYIRNTKLIKRHSISEVAYASSKMEYIKTKAEVESARHALKLSRQMLDICTFRAPFEGIVDQVLICAGLCADEQPAIQISQLVPMEIKIKMDRKTASKITANTPIKIYPLNSNIPIGIFNDALYYPNVNKSYINDEIIFVVDNYQLPPPISLDDNGKKIPVFSSFWYVMDLNNIKEADSNIATALSSIYHDKNGDYVWKLKGNKYLQSGKGTDYISPIQKVYVKTGNFSQYVASYVKIITLLQNDNLKVGDVLLSGNISNKLKEGDKVCIYNEKYLFMPGDPIKVVIEENTLINSQKVAEKPIKPWNFGGTRKTSITTVQK